MFGSRIAYLASRVLRSPDGGGGAGGGAAVSPPPPPPPPASFADQLPEDIRGEAAFRDIKDVGALARSYLHAQRMVGIPRDQIVTMPAEGDADGWSALFTRLGRPEKADGYKLTDPTLPDGLTVDDKLRGGFLALAHEIGLNNAQADKLFGWYNAQAGEAFTAGATAQAAARDQASTALKQEWGAAYEERLGLASTAIAHYADQLKLGDDVRQALDASGLGNNPALAKLFAHLGAQLREDGALPGRAAGGHGGALAPAEAQQQIAGLQQDKAFMAVYTNKSDAGHAAAVQRMQALYAQAYPG